MTWLKRGTWKLRGVRRGFEKERCPPCLKEDDMIYCELFGREKVEIEFVIVNG
jgi:hypothetical protein